MITPPPPFAVNSGRSQRYRNKPSRFGMLAFFEDGDVARHQSNLPKTFCIRTIRAAHQRWQQHPIMPGPSTDGLQLHSWDGGYRMYYWFPNEQYALHHLEKFSKETDDWFLKESNGEVHRLNQPFLGKKSYEDIAIVETRFVWNDEYKRDQIELPAGTMGVIE